MSAPRWRAKSAGRSAVVTDFLLFVVLIAVPGEPQISLANSLHDALQVSGIAHFLRESVNPILLALLGPLLPADVRATG